MITRRNIWWWLGGGAALVWLLSRSGKESLPTTKSPGSPKATEPVKVKGKPGELEITVFGPKESRTNIAEILLSAPANCPSVPQITKLLRVEGFVYVFEALWPNNVMGKLSEAATTCIFQHVKTFSPDVTKIVARRVS
jgi:hypothetical protein